jgi:hypothetical protein
MLADNIVVDAEHSFGAKTNYLNITPSKNDGNMKYLEVPHNGHKTTHNSRRKEHFTNSQGYTHTEYRSRTMTPNKS